MEEEARAALARLDKSSDLRGDAFERIDDKVNNDESHW